MEQVEIDTTQPFYDTMDIVKPTKGKLSRSLVQRLIARGELPSIVVGDRRLITAGVLDRFFKNGLDGLNIK